MRPRAWSAGILRANRVPPSFPFRVQVDRCGSAQTSDAVTKVAAEVFSAFSASGGPQRAPGPSDMYPGLKTAPLGSVVFASLWPVFPDMLRRSRAIVVLAGSGILLCLRAVLAQLLWHRQGPVSPALWLSQSQGCAVRHVVVRAGSCDARRHSAGACRHAMVLEGYCGTGRVSHNVVNLCGARVLS